jgi:hypothetical protein
MTPIVVQFDDNKTGESRYCNADFFETYQDGERFVIQVCDVMAFDNGDGDPIVGVSISLDARQLAELARALHLWEAGES